MVQLKSAGRTPRRARRWLGVVVGAVAAGLVAAPSAGAAFGDGFGIVPDSFGVAMSNSIDPAQTHDADFTAPATEAGSHPEYFTTKFDLHTFDDGFGNLTPDGNVRDIDVQLPPGLVINPQAAPKCDRGVFFVSPWTSVDCPDSTQVGVATPILMYGFDGSPVPSPLYNLTVGRDKPAEFGFIVGNTPVIISGAVVPTDAADGGYRIGARLHYVSNAIPLLGSSLTLWGTPADSRHDWSRGMCLEEPWAVEAPCAVDTPRRALLTAPARCDVGGLSSEIAMRSWQNSTFIRDSFSGVPAPTDCDQLPFDPTVSVTTDNNRAGAPVGLGVQLDVPQSDDPDQLATPPLRNVEMELPDGMAISPSAATGLGACSDAQLGLGNDDAVSCPENAKIGELTIDTPLLADPLTGPVYLGTQESNDPMSGEMYRMFMVAEGQGVRIKLRGAITADPATGKLRARFVDTPQMPFERLRVNLKGGSRAPLVNPTTCGATETRATLTSWAGQEAVRTSGGTVDEACPTGGFAPTFTAGTLNPLAGAFSPFTMTVSRQDGEPELQHLALDLPSGLLAAAGDVALCPEPHASEGTCGAPHRIGATTIAAGPGDNPFALRGEVYLAGAYKGAPLSLSVVVPAKAGPIDLGIVVVRAPLYVDAQNARVTAPADPLPTILGGVPLKIRSITVTLDRQDFMFNATSCEPMSVGADVKSTTGAAYLPRVKYQAHGCADVPFDPRLSLEFAGNASEMRVTSSRRGHPGITAKMTWPRGNANLEQARVTLPLAVALDPDNARALCTPEQAQARNCPEASIVGRASATTQALHEPLSGPVYFVEGRRTTAEGRVVPTLPRLWLKLEGQGVPLDLWANSNVSRDQLTATFVNVPDAPIREFTLEVFGGENGILAATTDVCAANRNANARYTGHSGKVTDKRLRIGAPNCTTRVASANADRQRVRLRVTGIGEGRLTARASGMRTVTRNIRSADAANLTLRLTPAARRQLANGRTVKRTIRVQFAPKEGEAVTVRRTVTINPARSSR